MRRGAVELSKNVEEIFKLSPRRPGLSWRIAMRKQPWLVLMKMLRTVQIRSFLFLGPCSALASNKPLPGVRTVSSCGRRVRPVSVCHDNSRLTGRFFVHGLLFVRSRTRQSSVLDVIARRDWPEVWRLRLRVVSGPKSGDSGYVWSCDAQESVQPSSIADRQLS